MITDVCKSNTLKVIKRDGKRASFNEDKIGLAIKKGFDSLGDKYTPDDSSLVYKKVIEDINKDYGDAKTIKIEDIQDLIEHNLRELGYVDVLESYSSYRENRAKSRSMFINRQHKLIKAIEALSLKDASEEDSKRDNANVNGDTAMGTMLQYGSTISKEFSKSYFIKPVHSDLHDSGMIHIHDMDFLPMGTTTCCQIDLASLFEKGFSTGHGYLRTPNSIMSYAALAAIVIQSNQNDQHGGQSIPAFDYYMAPGVVKSFKKSFKSHLFDYLELMGFDKFLNLNGIEKEISKIKEVNFSMNRFEKFFKESGDVELLFRKAHKKAIIDVEKQTYQAMESFIHNLNTMHSRAGAQVPFSSINFGTDTSFEGRMVIKNYLLATEAGLGNSETPIFPISIFKVKEGVNYNEGDPNYDLFKLACKVSAKRLFPNFSFIDSPFNKQYYKEGNINTEIAYMGCRTRVIANVADPEREIVTGRGNLSFTSINLVRLGIKYGIVDGTRKKADMEGFYKELADTMDMVRDQLLDRFEIQCKRHVYNFPFLLGQGIWIDSKGLKNKDGLRKVLKHGTLTEGFIGLAECLKALTGKHHGESKSSQELGLEIIKFMRNRCDLYAKEYKLNFSLIATPAEGLSGRFTAIDKSIYGIIPGVTDREY